MINEGLRKQIISIIDDVQDMTIATLREDGYPQATTVSYVNDGLTIYFGTAEDSQKARNISRTNKVSVTINRAYENWDEIEGLSMAAIANRISDRKEIEKVGGLLFKKFPQIAGYVPSGTENVLLFRLEPKVISVLDYSKSFGHTELVQL